jgi:hypothetical protein
MGVDAVAAVLWATYSVALGIWAGSLFHDNLLASIGVGIVGGVVLGFGVDKLLSLIGIDKPSLPDLASEIPAPVERDGDTAAQRDGD